MKPKHILVVSQYFHPEYFRINDMCCEWVRRGYKVTVLTGIPNYPRGKFYKGYGWFKRRKETWNGIDIIRIPLFARGKGPIRMVMNYLSFVFSGFFWQRFTKINADIVFTFEVSPMTQALIGVKYSQRRNIPHYLYVQDLWPENVITITGIEHPIVISPLSHMVDHIYRNSDRIFATSQSFVQEIRKRTPGEEEKVIYWPQYAEDFYVPLEKNESASDKIPDNGKFKIAFTGNIGKAQGLELLPKVAKRLKKEAIDDISFVIIGDGRQKEKLLRDIRKSGVADYFCMIERQPAEKISGLLAACDAAFVSFSPDPLFEKTIPAKLQSYMACGMPILAAACGETQRLIEESGCGLCCGLGDDAALTQGIKKLIKSDLSQMSANARKYFDANFRKDRLMDEMDEYFLTTV